MLGMTSCALLAVLAADVSVVSFGAVADGSEKCTRAFAAAIAACEKAGGGRVVVPQGLYFTGPIHLKSDVELHLEDGAIVEFSDDPADCLPAVRSSWEGLECLNYSPLVYAYCATNVALTGRGTIRSRMGRWAAQMERESVTWTSPEKDGRYDIQAARAILYKWGSEDWPVEKRDMTKAHPAVMRPQLVQFNRCKGVRIEGLHIGDSPFWTIHIFLSRDVAVRRIEVCARGFNNDGIDIEMSQNVLVEDSTFDQGDDCFVLKAGRNRDAWRIGVPTANVEIRNCRVKKAASLLCVGSELSAGVRDVWVHDCTAEEVARLFYVKTNHRRGGFVENIRLSRVKAQTMLKVAAVETDVLYQWSAFPDYETRITRMSSLSLEDIEIAGARCGIHFTGDARSPISGISVKNLKIGRTELFLAGISNAENVSLDGVSGGVCGRVETPWDEDIDAKSDFNMVSRRSR